MDFKFVGELLGVKESNNPEGMESLRMSVAVIVVSVALSDGEFAQEEKLAIVKALSSGLSLSEQKVSSLVLEAERDANQSLDRATTMIQEMLPSDKRIEILAIAWSIIRADNVISREESKFATMLRARLGLTFEQAVLARQMSEEVSIKKLEDLNQIPAKLSSMMHTNVINN